MMKLLLLVSIFALFYVYYGYLLLLKMFRQIKQTPIKPYSLDQLQTYPRITILLTVHNEEKRIVSRIQNILDCDYPQDKLEILIASDGSTDNTEKLVLSFGEKAPVKLFNSGGRFGKTQTQNLAIPMATGEIIAFTDAETTFTKHYLKALAAGFIDEKVGAVTAHLLFTSCPDSISESQGYYWTYELKLRQLESELGWLAVASGQAMAVRRSLIKSMDPSIGEDCIIPLDVVLQNKLVVHHLEAIAYDCLESEPEREFRTRVRMTLRNWLGTWSRPQLLNPFRHSGYAFALWSHKLLRWLSPWFLITATIASISLAHETPYQLVGMGMVVFYLLAFIGWQLEQRGKRIPLANTIFSFMLANVGFFVGVCKALAGHRIVTYKSGLLEQQSK